MLSKELEEKLLPSIQQVREKENVEMELHTHRRHREISANRYLQRVCKILSSKGEDERLNGALVEAKSIIIVLGILTSADSSDQ